MASVAIVIFPAYLCLAALIMVILENKIDEQEAIELTKIVALVLLLWVIGLFVSLKNYNNMKETYHGNIRVMGSISEIGDSQGVGIPRIKALSFVYKFDDELYFARMTTRIVPETTDIEKEDEVEIILDKNKPSRAYIYKVYKK